MRIVFAALVAAAAFPVRADEGMWPLDGLPAKILGERHGFSPSNDWLELVRLSAVRFNDGGSGSFVSPEGLVLTNHHVALGQLQKMSSAGKDYVRDGFAARSRGEEIPCPDLELNVLMSIEDVTARVLAAADPKAPEREQNEARKAEISRITKASLDATGLRSDVVELYHGGQYKLHRYKKYTDIRLAMAPEAQAAFYGGDPDNFTFPRHDLDFALFRVYEGGSPARPARWLSWSARGASEGELVFVAGHPGRTDRLLTVAQLEHERDRALPLGLERLRRRRSHLYAYAGRGAEPARRVKDMIFGAENSLKALGGYLEGLRRPELLGAKGEAEASLRRWAEETRVPEAEASRASWGRIAEAVRGLSARAAERTWRQYETPRIAGIAQGVVRYAAETAKPNEKRWEEYRESNLESLRLKLFSPAPLYPDLEEHLLAAALRDALEKLGPEDGFVKAALGGAAPEAKARELVSGTKLFDPGERRRLAEGGPGAVEASRDPLVAWARALDPVYRAQRKWYEDEVESVLLAEGRRISAARFSAYGSSDYPDATFTLRLSFGKVAGYDQGTNVVAPFTTFHGLFDRAAAMGGRPPFDIPARLLAARGRLDLETPLNFVSTNDIIGGNSGSPVLNARGELVGLIFDGNIQSLAGRYAYEASQNRAVSVHSAAIVEALRKVYGLGALADELAAAR